VTEKLVTTPSSIQIKPGDMLTPQELAELLRVPESWVFEQTRKRARSRNHNPLPMIRLGKYVRFSRDQVAE
jgi:hypothetical protein